MQQQPIRLPSTIPLYFLHSFSSGSKHPICTHPHPPLPPRQKGQRNFKLIWSISWSTLSLVPLNVFGSGPIICISWGTSCPEICVNFAKAFRHLKSNSSDGFALKNCSKAIVSSTATSSKTCKRGWIQEIASFVVVSSVRVDIRRLHYDKRLLPVKGVNFEQPLPWTNCLWVEASLSGNFWTFSGNTQIYRVPIQICFQG